MKANNTLILWQPADDNLRIGRVPPPGSIAIGPLDIESGDGYWSHHYNYECSGGAA
jgi:hypothetical protein